MPSKAKVKPQIISVPPLDKGLTIEEINQFKPAESKVRAIRFAGYYITPKGSRYKKIVCICECGTIFTTHLSSVTQGNTISCGCFAKKQRQKRGLTIADINNKKPLNSRLTALSFSGKHTTPGGQIIKLVNVKCACGKECVKRQPDIVSGHTMSCGCLDHETIIKRNTKYSKTIPKLWYCWNDMMRRCYDKTSSGYSYYGGRGVTVCPEWHDYEKFMNWALSSGWAIGLQLDKDKLGDGSIYSPQTCIFLTPKENNHYNMKKLKG